MAQIFRVEGSGFSYTFNDSFDLVDYSREISLPTRRRHGGEGPTFAAANQPREGLILNLRGFIQKPTVAQTLADLDTMRAAINALTGNIFLVDVEADRRIECKLLRSAIPREPARRANVSLFFQSNNPPYWEDRAITVATASTQNWVDLTVGNVNVTPDFTIEGFLSKPTLIKSNWALGVNMEHLEGTGLSVRNGKRLWDSFAGVSSNITIGGSVSFETGKLEEGITPSGKFTFSSMNDDSTPTGEVADRLNRKNGSFSGWVNVDFASTDTTENILFADGATTNPLEIRWQGGSTRFEISDGTNTAFRNPGAFSTGTWFYIVASWHEGGDVDGSGNELQIYVDTTAGTAAASYVSDTPSATLYLSTDALLAGKFDAILDDIAIFDYALSSTERSRLYNSGNGLQASHADQMPITYFPLDGSGIVSETGLGSTSLHPTRIDITSATTTAITVPRKGTLYRDNDYLVLKDRLGFHKYAFVAGTPTATNIPIDDGSSGAITDADQVGVYATLDGSTDYFNITTTTVHDITTGDFGASIWFRTTATSAQTLLAKGNGPTNAGYYIQMNSSGNIVVTADNGTTNDQHTTSGAYNDGFWHHAMYTYDSGGSAQTTLFMDGIEDAGPGLAGGNFGNSNSFTIGALSDGTEKFNGDIRDVKFWGTGSTNFITTATQTRDAAWDTHTDPLTAQTLGVTARVEDGWWKFTDATAGALGTDSAASPNNLTQVGSPARTVTAFVDQNLIVLADQEEGPIGPVTRPSSNVVGDILVKNTSVFKKGVASMRFDWSTATGFDLRFKGERSGVYRFSFWYTTNSEGAAATFALRDDTAATNYAFGTLTNDSNWHYFEKIIQVGTGGILEHAMLMQLTGAAVARILYYDDLRFEPHILADGDMDTPANWSDVGTPTKVTESTNVHGGGTSTEILASGATEGIEHAITPVASTWYEFFGYVRGDAGSETITISLQAFSDVSGYNATRTITATTSFERFSLAPRFVTDVAGNVRITAADTDRIYIDDVGVVERLSIDADLSQIVSVAVDFPVIRPAEFGVGRDFSGGGVSYSSLFQRSEIFGFMLRIRANNDWTNQPERVFFDYNRGTSTATLHHYKLSLATNRWVFGNASGTLGAPVTAYSLNKDMQIAGYVDHTKSTVIAKLFEDHVEIGSTSTFPTLSVVTLTRANFGLDRDGTTPANVIMQDAYFLHQGVGDSFFKGEGAVRNRIALDHHEFSYASVIATLDYLAVFGEERRIDHWSIPTPQSPTLVKGNEWHNSTFPVLGGDNAFSHSYRETFFTRKAITVTFNYRKRFY